MRPLGRWVGSFVIDNRRYVPQLPTNRGCLRSLKSILEFRQYAESTYIFFPLSLNVCIEMSVSFCACSVYHSLCSKEEPCRMIAICITILVKHYTTIYTGKVYVFEGLTTIYPYFEVTYFKIQPERGSG